MKDYYEILGVERSATKEELKKRFRELSMKYHPDRNPEDPEAESKFKEVNEAYSVLSNDEKRAAYDDPMSGLGGFNPFAGFGMRFHRPQRPNPNAPADGKLIQAGVKLPLNLYLFGGKLVFRASFHEGCTTCGAKGFTEYETCPACQGVGVIQKVVSRPGFHSVNSVTCGDCQGMGLKAKNTCPDCNGQGNILVENKEFVFEIPEDIEIGRRLILSGIGRSGLNGGRRGDVVLLIEGVDRHSLTEAQRAGIREVFEDVTESIIA